MKKLLTRILKTFLPLFFGLALLWYFFYQMEGRQLQVFYNALKSANYWWVILSVLLSIIPFFLRAERWKLNLEPMNYTTKWKNRYHSLMIGYLVNLTIPRAGEASRAVMLYRSEKVPFAKSFGTIISERLVDLLFLGSIAVLTYFLNTQNFLVLFDEIKATFKPENSSHFKLYFYGVVGILFAALFIAYLLKPNFRQKINTFIGGLFNGLFSIFKMKKSGLYLLYSFFIWLIYVTDFALCFYALDATAQLSFSAILLAFIAGSLGITFTNGGIGAFPLLVGIVIGIVGKDTIPDAQAVGNALGMIIWTSQTLLVVILGVISLLLLPKPNQEADDTLGKTEE